MNVASEPLRYQYDFDPEGDSTAAQVVRLVGDRKKVLELGCGPGSITRVLNQHAHCRITAVELGSEAAAQAAAWCEQIHVASLDDGAWPALLGEDRFDVIVFADVLEHLRDPVRALRQAAALLRPRGHMVISLPNIAHNGVVAALLRQSFPYRETGLLDDTHIRFFARSNLPGLLGDAGLRMSSCIDVRGAAQHTEFAPYWFQLTEAQRRTLSANPEGDVYQFVIKAMPVTDQDEEPVPDMEPAGAPASAKEAASQLDMLRQLHQQGLFDRWKRTVAEGERAVAEQKRTMAEEGLSRLRSTYLGRLAGLWLRVRRRLLPRAESVADRTADPQASRGWHAIALEDRIPLTLRQYDLPRLPLMSVVVDVGDEALHSPLLRQTIDSLRDQTYFNYQIVYTRHRLDDLMPALNGDSPWDARWSAPTGARAESGMSPSQALELVGGEFVVQIAAGDQMHATALQALAQVLATNPAIDVLTFDHASEAGDCVLPGWSQEFHLARNVVGRAVAIRTAALRQSVPKGMQLPDPYAWMLAVWAEYGESAMQHQGQILLHHGPRAWGDASEAADCARQLASRRYPNVAFESLPSGHLVLVHAVPEPAPLVSIIIPTRNAAQLVRTCMDSVLERTRYPNYEILLVDNGSDDPEALALFDSYAPDPRVRVLRDDAPFNFSALNNRAARQARGAYLLLLNNDTEVITPDWLDRMMGYAVLPDTGAVGARLWYPDDTLQHGGVVMLNGGPTHQFSGSRRDEPGPLHRAWLTQRYLAVTGACLLVRASRYWQVGGLDEAYAVGFNDVDICFRLHASGLRNLWVAQAELYHHESPSRGFDTSPEKRARAAAEYALLRSRWESFLLYDPYA